MSKSGTEVYTTQSAFQKLDIILNNGTIILLNTF